MFQMTEDTSEINMQAEYDELALLLANINANFSNAFEVLANKLQDACLAPTAEGSMDLERPLVATLPSTSCSEVLPLSAEVSRAQVDREPVDEFSFTEETRSKMNWIVAARFIHSKVSSSFHHKSLHLPVEILEMLHTASLQNIHVNPTMQRTQKPASHSAVIVASPTLSVHHADCPHFTQEPQQQPRRTTPEEKVQLFIYNVEKTLAHLKGYIRTMQEKV
ncbi:hypothetical protein BKA57DRAFT_523616 [Linnemannia elongata]|nr:hypothetical protein BKA57DRAFT_523616 [Linnemannia elongata]